MTIHSYADVMRGSRMKASGYLINTIGNQHTIVS